MSAAISDLMDIAIIPPSRSWACPSIWAAHHVLVLALLRAPQRLWASLHNQAAAHVLSLVCVCVRVLCHAFSVFFTAFSCVCRQARVLALALVLASAPASISFSVSLSVFVPSVALVLALVFAPTRKVRPYSKWNQN